MQGIIVILGVIYFEHPIPTLAYTIIIGLIINIACILNKCMLHSKCPKDSPKQNFSLFLITNLLLLIIFIIHLYV